MAILDETVPIAEIGTTYQAHWFTTFGRLPRDIGPDGRFTDELLMVWMLDA